MFGFRGDVRVYLHNPDTETFDEPREVILVAPDGRRRTARMAIRPGAGKRILGRIDGVDTEDAARAMMDTVILIDRADLPEPDDGFYVHDVLDWPVFVGTTEVGRVAAIHATDGDDILEIATAGDPAFVPMIEEFVLHVDFDNRRVLLADDALVEP